MSDVVLDPVIMSSCIFMEDESAVKEVESIENMVSMHLKLLILFGILN